VHRRFQLERDADPTGVSGTGVVAEGCLFSDGSAAIRWATSTCSSVFWDAPNAAENIEKVHGHNGLSRIVYLD
jgi:hypothetical protein